jgi:hypothetical protein
MLAVISVRNEKLRVVMMTYSALRDIAETLGENSGAERSNCSEAEEAHDDSWKVTRVWGMMVRLRRKMDAPLQRGNTSSYISGSTCRCSSALAKLGLVSIP